jgi:hypothetical protein
LLRREKKGDTGEREREGERIAAIGYLIPAWAVRRVPVKVPMPMLGTTSPDRSVIFGSC